MRTRLGHGRLAHALDQEPGVRERVRVRLKRAMDARERDLETVAAESVRVVRALEVRAADDEGAVRLFVLEAPRRVQRMDDRKAEAAARLEHASRFRDGQLEVVDVLERHERDHEVEVAVLERQRGGVGEPNVELGVGLACGGDHRPRRVDADHVVTRASSGRARACLRRSRGRAFAARAPAAARGTGRGETASSCRARAGAPRRRSRTRSPPTLRAGRAWPGVSSRAADPAAASRSKSTAAQAG